MRTRAPCVNVATAATPATTIEDPDDLIADLERGLGRLNRAA